MTMSTKRYQEAIEQLEARQPMNRERELKPCPFCGAAAMLERGNDHHGDWFNLGCSSHWDSASDPDEACPARRLWNTQDLEDEAKAIDSWNTRAALSAPKEDAVEPVDYQWREGRSTRHAPNEWDWSPWHAGRLPAHVENREYRRCEERPLYTSPVPAITNEAVERATHRHKKRGTEYVLIGIGKMQCDWWEIVGSGVRYPVDMREVAIYRSVDDGSLWVRPREEFEDGRFEVLAALKGGE